MILIERKIVTDALKRLSSDALSDKTITAIYVLSELNDTVLEAFEFEVADGEIENELQD